MNSSIASASRRAIAVNPRFTISTFSCDIAHAVSPRRGETSEMTTIALDRRETDVEPGYRGFLDLATAARLDLEPFQRRIARAALGPEHVLTAALPLRATSSRTVISRR